LGNPVGTVWTSRAQTFLAICFGCRGCDACSLQLWFALVFALWWRKFKL